MNVIFFILEYGSNSSHCWRITTVLTLQSMFTVTQYVCMCVFLWCQPLQSFSYSSYFRHLLTACGCECVTEFYFSTHLHWKGPCTTLILNSWVISVDVTFCGVFVYECFYLCTVIGLCFLQLLSSVMMTENVSWSELTWVSILHQVWYCLVCVQGEWCHRLVPARICLSLPFPFTL